MPAYEEWDEKDSSDFFLNWQSVITVTLPDFTGRRVEAFESWKGVSRIMGHLRLAFPEAAISDEGDKRREYFDQCPTMYSTPKMKSFAKRCTHKEVKKMILNAKCFVKDATDKWNLTGKEPTESTYLGLIGIDESASKECGAVLLDLMLRAGVLHQTNDGEWKLDENWEHRKVYFFGDAKTIENVTKFVRDVQERRLSYCSFGVN